MGVIQVVRERHTVVCLTTACICNACGKRVEAKEPSEGLPPGIHEFKFHGSHHESDFPREDDTIEGTICDECLKAWVATFKVPPEHYYLNTQNPLEVIHSETQEPLIYQFGWVRRVGVVPNSVPAWDTSLFPNSGVYKHFKGNNYKVVGYAFDWETKEPMVIYLALYGESKLFARPAKMWADHIERDGFVGPRFTFQYTSGD